MRLYSKIQDDLEVFIQQEKEPGYTKFMAGKSQTLNEVNELRIKIKRKGVDEAFIVPYYKAKRIRMVDAIEFLGE